MKTDKKGIIVMICNIIIMIANYVINIFSKPETTAFIKDVISEVLA